MNGDGGRAVRAAMLGLGVWAAACSQDPTSNRVASGRSATQGIEARYQQVIPWNKAHFTRVLGVGYSELGIELDRSRSEMVTVDGLACVVANVVSLDVDDQYAFDIDESVALTVTYAPELTTAAFQVLWDKNGGEGRGSLEVKPEAGATLRRVSLSLDRARFAGNGGFGTDVAVGSSRGRVCLCDIEIARSGTTTVPATFGRVRLEVKDARTERTVPARVGLYDATGRAPLPSDHALLVHRFMDDVRMLWMSPRVFWPSPNRQAFYVEGTYEARVPAGTYDLVVARGPEYRAHRSHIQVRPDNLTAVTVSLERYVDMIDRGWYSGESHIHLGREQTDDARVWTQIAAEDLRVANLLQMGNIVNTYFKQPAWGKAGRFDRDGYLLVSGQEDPRTGHRGHTIQWNLEQPIHSEEDYYSYHKVFEGVRRQGGVTGYAHLGLWFNGQRGLALDVPFGIIDFIECLQWGRLQTDIWYGFLNLGYKLTPAAGADFPYADVPGAYRNYVKLTEPFTADAWFSAFKQGHTYVTNGPFLELSVNGQQMGEELRVRRGTRLEVVAEAELNPDVDTLDRLELVVHGDVLAQQKADTHNRVRLRKELTADRSMWIAARALGARNEPRNVMVAHSTPVYVIVDDQPFWKTEDVPTLVHKQRAHLEELISKPVDPVEDLEAWTTGDALRERWARQRPLIKERAAEAISKYEQLLQHAQTPSSAPR